MSTNCDAKKHICEWSHIWTLDWRCLLSVVALLMSIILHLVMNTEFTKYCLIFLKFYCAVATARLNRKIINESMISCKNHQMGQFLKINFGWKIRMYENSNLHEMNSCLYNLDVRLCTQSNSTFYGKIIKFWQIFATTHFMFATITTWHEYRRIEWQMTKSVRIKFESQSTYFHHPFKTTWILKMAEQFMIKITFQFHQLQNSVRLINYFQKCKNVKIFVILFTFKLSLDHYWNGNIFDMVDLLILLMSSGTSSFWFVHKSNQTLLKVTLLV